MVYAFFGFVVGIVLGLMIGRDPDGASLFARKIVALVKRLFGRISKKADETPPPAQ